MADEDRFDPWYAEPSAEDRPRRAIEMLPLLMSPAARLFERVWEAEDRENDPIRRFICGALPPLLQDAGFSSDPTDQALVALCDWWLFVALKPTEGVDAGTFAYQIEQRVPGALGRHLRSMLDESPPTLRRALLPLKFDAACKALADVLEHPPAVNTMLARQRYADAAEAARGHLPPEGQPIPAEPPPAGWLLTADLGAWAAAPNHQGRALLPNTPVWNNLVKHAHTLRHQVERVRRLWTPRAPGATLPGGWVAAAGSIFGRHAPLARALLGTVADDDPGAGVLSRAAQVRRLNGLGQPTDARAVALLPLARELSGEHTGPMPPWVKRGEEHRRKLRAEIDVLRKLIDASDVDASYAATIDDVERELDRFRVQSETIELLRAEVEKIRGDADRIALFERAITLYTDIVRSQQVEDTDALGPPPAGLDAAPEALQAWLDALQAAHRGAFEALSARLESLAVRCGSLRTGDVRRSIEQSIDEARALLDQGRLADAADACRATDRDLEGAFATIDTRLGRWSRQAGRRIERLPELARRERKSAEQAVARVVARAEWSLPYTEQQAALDRWLDAAEAGRLLDLGLLVERTRPAAPGDVGDRLVPVCWSETGITFDVDRLDPHLLADAHGPEADGDPALLPAGALAGLDPSGYQPFRVQRIEAPAANRYWDIIEMSDPGWREAPVDLPAAPTPAVFVGEGDEVIGPLRVRPTDQRLMPGPATYEATLLRDAFERLFGAVTTPSGRTLVVDPPAVETLCAVGAEPIDIMPPHEQDHWLYQTLESMHGINPEQLEGVDRLLIDLPEVIREQRLARYDAILATSRWMAAERQRIAAGWLETEEGQREIARSVLRRVDERRDEIEARLAAEVQRVEDRLAQLEDAEQTARDRAETARREAEAELDDLQTELEATRHLLEDASARLMLEFAARLSGGAAVAAPTSTPARHRPSVPTPPVSRPRLAPGRLLGLEDAAQHLAAQLHGWDPQLICNLMLTLLTSNWTVLAGPPGVGKSTLARQLLEQIGARRATGGLLEVSVRREWHDDTPLFGYWHPTGDYWVPSADGLVEHILAAGRPDAETVLHAALLEELNLAAPEHYLSRLLVGLEASPPTIDLYSPALTPRNAADYPRAITIPDTFRLVGTVNVDDTVERLSPRFLSRISVCWIEQRADALFDPPPASLDPGEALDWQHLRRQCLDREPPEVSKSLRRLIEFLVEKRVPGGPTPRAFRALQRYLAAAPGVLDIKRAEDFCITQRILPGLRGVGIGMARTLDELARMLRQNGWNGAAERCELAREAGEASGHFYDLFHA